MDMQEKWICDSCGKTIECKEDGWLEWLTYSTEDVEHPHRPRIVHRVGCLYDEDDVFKKYNATVSDGNLEDYLGPNGLMELLFLASETTIEDLEDFIKIIKRLHIPNYEMSFRHFDHAISMGVFEPNTKPDYYSQNDMLKTIGFAKTTNT